MSDRTIFPCRPFVLTGLLMLTLVGLVSGSTAMAPSQASTGQIVGTVVDQQGAAIVGAEVTVTNTETGLKRVVQTNSAGQYRVVLLPAGRYEVSAEASGFQRMVQSGVIVTVGSSVDVNFAFRVGEITETVEVTGPSASKRPGQSPAPWSIRRPFAIFPSMGDGSRIS